MKKFFTSHGWLVTMLAGMILFSTTLRAQNVQTPAANQPGTPITGIVVDEKGAPLQGVSVTVKGSTTGITTDSTGKFTIRVAKGGTLVFSYIKYGTQELPITDQHTVTISMTPTTTSMNDVVVVGYGTQRKATLTGSVAQISGLTLGFSRAVSDQMKEISAQRPAILSIAAQDYLHQDQ